MLAHTREPSTGGFVNLTFCVPTRHVDLVNRVVNAIVAGYEIPRYDEKESYSPEEVFGEPSPGKSLRGYRHREALTQAQLAEKIGVSKQNISDMECGRRPIGKDMAQRIGEALNAPWKRFI